METFPSGAQGAELGNAGTGATRRASQRVRFEALGFLLGMLTILLGLVLTVGACVPIGP